MRPLIAVELIAIGIANVTASRMSFKMFKMRWHFIFTNGVGANTTMTLWATYYATFVQTQCLFKGNACPVFIRSKFAGRLTLAHVANMQSFARDC